MIVVTTIAGTEALRGTDPSPDSGGMSKSKK